MLKRMFIQLWDLLFTKQWEKGPGHPDHDERHAAARGIITPRALEKRRWEFLARRRS